jgi:hypothetical protein
VDCPGHLPSESELLGANRNVNLRAVLRPTPLNNLPRIPGKTTERTKHPEACERSCEDDSIEPLNEIAGGFKQLARPVEDP